MPLTATQIERATILAWPALEEATHGPLTARFANGFTKRANSMHTLTTADDPEIGVSLDALSELYRAKSLRPLFRQTPLACPALIAALDARGWDSFEHSRVLTMPLPAAPLEALDNIAAAPLSDPHWRATQCSLAGYDTDTATTFGLILDRITHPARALMVLDATGEPAGAALAVVAEKTAVFLNVVVAHDKRGRGFGRLLMQAALNHTIALGATNAAIQVLADNAVALSLYRSLGFVQAFTYHYRRAPL